MIAVALRRLAHRRIPAAPHSASSSRLATLTVRRRQRRAGLVVLEVAGEIDLLTAPSLGQALAAVRAPKLVIDLSEVTFLSAAGLGMLELVAQRADETTRQLRVVACSAAVLRPLSVVDLDRQIPIYLSVQDAIRSADDDGKDRK
jgi:anti-sigma B factor antagonist